LLCLVNDAHSTTTNLPNDAEVSDPLGVRVSRDLVGFGRRLRRIVVRQNWGLVILLRCDETLYFIGKTD
jgi:hypothetical protein